MPRAGEILDVSVPMREHMPQWDGEDILRTDPIERTPEDLVNVTRLTLTTHTGTHVDAPRHFVHEGKALDEIALDRWVGPALVVDCTSLHRDITGEDLDGLDIPAGTTRLIFKTRNSELWEAQPQTFVFNYIALAPSGAQWVVNRQIRLVGIDYLSIGSVDDDGVECHLMLLRNEVLIVEGLNLSQVQAGPYELLCFPLSIAGSDGAPARVALRALAPQTG